MMCKLQEMQMGLDNLVKNIKIYLHLLYCINWKLTKMVSTKRNMNKVIF
jgi:hypothetical protein